MGVAYDKCIGDAEQYQSKLKKLLTSSTSKDVFVNYSDVARAFPAREPHPRSFDIPLIDDKWLKEWVRDLGWNAMLVDEKSAEDGFQLVKFVIKET